MAVYVDLMVQNFVCQKSNLITWYVLCLLWAWETHYSGPRVVPLIGMLSSRLPTIINQDFYFFASQEIGDVGRTPLEILLAERSKQEKYEYFTKHVGM